MALLFIHKYRNPISTISPCSVRYASLKPWWHVHSSLKYWDRGYNECVCNVISQNAVLIREFSFQCFLEYVCIFPNCESWRIINWEIGKIRKCIKILWKIKLKNQYRDIIGLRESTNIQLKARNSDMQGQVLRWLFPGTRMRSHRPEGA